MLTRIEIDGFKTFRDFAMDVPPFLVLLGRNASGKSNLFEALQFLRAASQGNLTEAARQVRGGLSNFFHRYEDDFVAETATFAVEVTLPAHVTDGFQTTEPIAFRTLRYELRVARSLPHLGSLVLDNEVAHSTGGPAEKVLFRSPSGPSYVLRRVSGAERTFGAGKAALSVLSSVTRADDSPELFALREQMSQWATYSIVPERAAQPSKFGDELLGLQHDGANLANALHQMVLDTRTPEKPEGSLSRLRADLHAVVPDIVNLRIRDDLPGNQREIVFTDRGGQDVPAIIASEGTLRTLAVLLAVYTARAGVISIEEPENGVFPTQVLKLLHGIRRAVSMRHGDDAPQVMISSHAPTVAKAMLGEGLKGDSSLMLADLVTKIAGSPRRESRATRVRPVMSAASGMASQVVTGSELRGYLAAGEEF